MLEFIYVRLYIYVDYIAMCSIDLDHEVVLLVHNYYMCTACYGMIM